MPDAGGRSASASIASSRARSGSSSKLRKRPAIRRPSTSTDSSPVARSAASPGSISGSPSAGIPIIRAANARSSAAIPPVAPAIPMRSSTTPSSVNASRARPLSFSVMPRATASRACSSWSCARVHASAGRSSASSANTRARTASGSTPRHASPSTARWSACAQRTAVLLARRRQALGGEVARGLGKRVADAVLAVVGAPDERGVDQAAERVDRVDRSVAAGDRGDGFDGVERGGTGERGQAREQRALGGLEQLVGPFQRGAQAAVALGAGRAGRGRAA